MPKKGKFLENNSDAQARRVNNGNKFENEIYEYLQREIGENKKIRLMSLSRCTIMT
jgi:hypothetical protein